MAFYNTIFISIVLLTLFAESLPAKDRRVPDILMLLILAAVTALHGVGGTDYFIYQRAYERTPLLTEVTSNLQYFREQIFNFEPGYLLIISALKTVGIDFYGYLVSQSLVFYSLIYVGLKRFTKHWGLVMLVFMYKMLFYDTFVSMRQPITIACFYFIVKYIYEGKFWKYMLCCIPLMFIHYGAAMLPLIYLIRCFKITRIGLIVLSLIFLPTAILAQMGFGANLNTIMSFVNPDKSGGYGQHTEVLNIAYTLEYYLIMVGVILNFQDIIKLKYGELVIKLVLVMLPIVTLFSGVIILRRELDYLFLFYGILGGYICDVAKKAKMLVIALFTVVSYYGYDRYLQNFDRGGLIPYKTWIETRK